MSGGGEAKNLIQNLLTSKNGLIKKTSDAFLRERDCPEIVTALWKLLTTANDREMREYSANLLWQRLMKFGEWKLVAPDNEELRESGILKIIIHEPNEKVREAIIQFLAELIRIEAKNDETWMASLVDEICDVCCAADLDLARMMAKIFLQLLKLVPNNFDGHIVAICQMYNVIFLNAIANDKNAKTVIAILLESLGKMLMAIHDDKSSKARPILGKLIQYIIRLLNDLVLEKTPDNFLAAMRILEHTFYIMPETLKPHLKDITDFCSAVVLDNSDSSLMICRTTALMLITAILFNEPVAIMKVSRMETVIALLFDVIANTKDCENDTAYFNGYDTKFGGRRQRTLMSIAARAMYTLPKHKKLESFREMFVEMLKKNLEARNPYYRYAAYISLGLIIEHTISHVSQKYFFSTLKCIENGLVHPNLVVRSGAIFAFNQLSLHLAYINLDFSLRRLFPIVHESMERFCKDLTSRDKYGNVYQHKNIERILYCFYWYFNVLELDITPYLSDVVTAVMETLNQNYPLHVRGHSLAFLACLFRFAREELLLKWMPEIVESLHVYFIVDARETESVSLRGHAVNLLTAIVRRVSQRQCVPMMLKTKTYALRLLESAPPDEHALKADLYRLFAGLSRLLEEELKTILPIIIDSMLQTLHATKSRINQLAVEFLGNQEPSTQGTKIVIAPTARHHEVNECCFSIRLQNVIVDILTALRDFTQHTPHALVPYVDKVFTEVYHLLSHQSPAVRRMSLSLLVNIVELLFKTYEAEKNACRPENLASTQQDEMTRIFISKLFEIIKEDRDTQTVIDALKALSKMWQCNCNIMKSFEERAFNSIIAVLQQNITCMHGDRVSISATERLQFMIFDETTKLLKYLASISSHFTSHFSDISSAFVKELEDESTQTRRCIIYDVLQRSFPLLKENCCKHFGKLYPMLLKGLHDQMGDIRFYSVRGLGDLVLNTRKRSYGHFPDILEALTIAMNAERCFDIIFEMCLTLSKLIVTNASLVPLESTLPNLMRILLPRDGVLCCNNIGMECFDLLYSMQLEALYAYLERVVHVVIQTNKKPCRCHKAKIIEITRRLFHNMINNYPKEYENINKMVKYTTQKSNPSKQKHTDGM